MESFWGGNHVRPEAAHFAVAIFLAPGFFGARYLLETFVFQPLSIRFVCGTTVPLKIDEAKQAKIVKCCESLWKLAYYVTVQYWILRLMQEESWLLKTKDYFIGWPTQELTISLRLFYMWQFGFYLYSIGALLLWETRRKDFSIMMSHHIITSILIGYSYCVGFFRIGTMVLALHDTSDVFMEAAKVFKYSEKEMTASFFFGLFATSWLLLRLIFFPFWIIRASSYYAIVAMKKSGFPTTLYYVSNTMLLNLLIFHIYWWILICAMIKRQLNNKGQVGEDIRSDSEGDD